MKSAPTVLQSNFSALFDYQRERLLRLNCGCDRILPARVIVYVPFAGFGTLLPPPLLLPPPPPQAEIASPSDASAITQANCRSLRDDRPRNPASTSPAKAIPAGTGLFLFGVLLLAFTEPPVCGITRRPRPLTAPPVELTQSDAFVSIVICPRHRCRAWHSHGCVGIEARACKHAQVGKGSVIRGGEMKSLSFRYIRLKA